MGYQRYEGYTYSLVHIHGNIVPLLLLFRPNTGAWRRPSTGCHTARLRSLILGINLHSLGLDAGFLLLTSICTSRIRLRRAAIFIPDLIHRDSPFERVPVDNLRQSDDEDTIKQLRTDVVRIDTCDGPVAGSKADLPLKDADFARSPVDDEGVAELLVHVGAVHHAREQEGGGLGIVVDRDVLLLCAGEGDVDDILGRRVEDVGAGHKVHLFVVGSSS
ncbi:hypothetical protein I7I53_02734 [Histoplasma capsulatum var. duboisii H88]|uniref:Uncharacterized protein n=1 Tax=Ajellomyces capsulatus (strain H88) TaxID=544711 RepID=A0A8A1LLZ3_AJEC8|nr:hypothetical protein I7I53_02734 [Histoplasma capsulatum var. duboisii H88]